MSRGVLAPTSLLVAYKAGQVFHGVTTTRASVAHRVTRKGLIGQVPTGIIRNAWYDTGTDARFETVATLIESARTNGWATFTNDYANAAWTKVNATTVSSNATTAPDGVAASADKIIESPAGSGSVAHGVERTFAGATDNTRSSASALFKASERTFAYAELTRKDATTVTVWFNLSTAAKGTVEAGVDGFVRKFPSGWVWVGIAGSVLSGATTPKVRWGLATADNVKAYTGDGASGLFLWESAVEVDKAFPSEPGSILPNGLARVADALTQSVAFGPQDMTVYAEMVRPVHADATGNIVVFPGVMTIGPVSGLNGLSIFYRANLRQIAARIRGTTGRDATSSVPAGNPLRMAAQYRNLTTGGQVALDVNDGAGYTAFSTATEAFAAFGNQTVDIGAFAGVQLSGGLISLKIAAGLHSLATMQQLRTPFGS